MKKPVNSFWGKLLGSTCGLLLFRHPLGLIIGLYIGYLFDKGFIKVIATRQSHAQSQQADYHHDTTSTTLNAYKTLGLSPGASMQEIKKAYHTLMSQYHPDKLAAKDLPAEMLKWSTQKTQEIKDAYNLLKKRVYP